MEQILGVIGIYTLVFMTDYMFYVKQTQSYQFVSRRTWLLFTGGQIAIISLFIGSLWPFYTNIMTELCFIALLTVLLFAFTYILSREQSLVCYVTSRTERCLSPKYVLIKGAEIVFQQLAYAAIALQLAAIFGHTLAAYAIFMLLLILMHTPVVIGSNKDSVQRLTFGLVVMAAPLFYIYVSVGYFFPAVYLHSLMYVFYWLTFADFDQD